MYVCLLSISSPFWCSSELESVFNTESIQPVIEQSSNIEFMSLRDDGTLLLVCCQNEIHIYQAEDLLQKGADPLLTYKVGGVKLGAWEPTVDLKSATAIISMGSDASGAAAAAAAAAAATDCVSSLVSVTNDPLHFNRDLPAGLIVGIESKHVVVFRLFVE